MSFTGDLAKFIQGVALATTASSFPLERELPNFLSSALTEAIKRFSWLGVRSFGNLQILTKASYVSLLLVPIIAGIWPLIRSSINKYNTANEEAAELARAAAEEVRQKILQLEVSSEGFLIQQQTIILELRNLSDLLSEIASNVSYTIEQMNMPPSFALAFFASLSVAFGHLIYQALCPTNVKEFSLREFVQMRVASFSENNSEIMLSDSLKRISSKVSIPESEILGLVRTGRISTAELYDRVQTTSREEADEDYWSTAVRMLAGEATQTYQEEELLRDKSIVEVAARMEYTDEMTSGLGAGLSSLFLYMAGAALILSIVVRQVFSVIHAAGWL